MKFPSKTTAGLAVAVAEMCIAGRCGATVGLDGFDEGLTDGAVLFDQRRACYVLECGGGSGIDGAAVVDIGTVSAEASLVIRRRSETLAELSVTSLDEAWRAPLAAVGGV